MKRVCIYGLILCCLCASLVATADSRSSRYRKKEILKKQRDKQNTPVQWNSDLNKALKEARQKNGKVFLLITGSTWCGPCKLLESKVLSSSDFAKYASKNLALLKVDVPARGNLTSEGQKITRQYPFRGVPMVYILDSNGKVLERRSGYGGASPKDYIKSFKSLK